MKKVTRVVALAVLAVVSLAWLSVLSIHGPQAIRTSWEVAKLKLSGRAAYLSWGQVLWYVVPDGLRSSSMRPLRFGWACMRAPVRVLKAGSGSCSTQWETPLGHFWGNADEGEHLAFLSDEELTGAVYNRPPVAVRQGDVVIDGGAHIGTFSRFAFNHGARKVIAFEPDPSNAECLKRNFEEELGDARMVLVQKALWDRSGVLNLMHGTHSGATKVSEATGLGEGLVPATTIDDALAELKLDRVDFIKLDIEGAERHAMAGAARTLGRFGPRMVLCTYHLPGDAVKITETVLRLRPSYWVFATFEQAYFYEEGGGGR